MTSSFSTDFADVNSEHAPSTSNAVGQSLAAPATHSVEQETFSWVVRGDTDNIHVELINHGSYNSEIHVSQFQN
jgi:hypothetical protein